MNSIKKMMLDCENIVRPLGYEEIDKLTEEYNKIHNAEAYFPPICRNREEKLNYILKHFNVDNLEDIYELGAGVCYYRMSAADKLTKIYKKKRELLVQLYLNEKEYFINKIQYQLCNLEHCYSFSNNKEEVLYELSLDGLISVDNEYYLECFEEAEKRYYRGIDTEDI